MMSEPEAAAPQPLSALGASADTASIDSSVSSRSADSAGGIDSSVSSASADSAGIDSSVSMGGSTAVATTSSTGGR